VSVSFPALGTTATVAASYEPALEIARTAVAAELDDVDRSCSRFRPDSDLARIVSARGRAVHVSPLLLEAMHEAIRAARVTGGLVDPTVGRSLRLAGYDATFPIVTARDGTSFRARFVAAPGWQTIEIDEPAGTIRVPDGVELDLGATAKALAADRCARAAAAAARCGVLIALGGDVAVAGEPPGGGWPVGIADDHATAPGEVHETVAIASGGLATSSTSVRRWRSGTQVLHHVVEPRTGRPADSCWRTVSVAAASCLDANIASTASILLGEAALDWLDERRLPARLVALDGSVVRTGGWPAEAAVA